MSDKIKVAEAIERQAKTYQAIIDAAAILKEIGSLEQASAETKAAAESARKEAEAAHTEAKQAKADAKAAKDKVAEMLAKAADQVLDVVADGEIKAKGIINGAELRASEIVAAAERSAADRTSGITTQIAQLTAIKGGIEQDIATLGAVADGKLKEVEALESRLAKAQAQIAKH